MKTIRKIIVRTCALSYRIGKGNVLRVSIAITLVAVVDLLVNIIFGGMDAINWYDWGFISVFAFLIWAGFSWAGIGYFALWPVRFEELDDYQKYVFSRVNFHDLTEEQAAEVRDIIARNDHWF